MAKRVVDLDRIMELMGYAPGEIRSVQEIRITSDLHRIIVTRVVQDPDSTEPKRLRRFEPSELPLNTMRPEDAPDGFFMNDLVVDDVIYYEMPKERDPRFNAPASYVKLSRSAIAALKKLQWGV